MPTKGFSLAHLFETHAERQRGDTSMSQRECESCLEGGLHTAATTQSTHPDWSGYALCADCAAEYDARPRPDDTEEDLRTRRPQRLPSRIRWGHSTSPIRLRRNAHEE